LSLIINTSLNLALETFSLSEKKERKTRDCKILRFQTASIGAKNKYRDSYRKYVSYVHLSLIHTFSDHWPSGTSTKSAG